MEHTVQTPEQQPVPVFLTSENKAPAAVKQEEISLFDVKDLYDRAYAAKDNGVRGKAVFKKLLAEAVKLDLAYRRQLSDKASYKDKTKLTNFNSACEGHYAA